ncbi:Hypothetical_protein [Hexamita inflata]|uniref:Hypothetical_protein n=1 Tax=Hexamita inflata TaxID=28002 RepID=A0AA86UEJ6_9EUKA|nr:Hypothetical protein HINF_LOCUS40244 [Hexamita inflata]
MQRVQITKRFEAFGFIGWQDNANISVQQGNYFSCWARGSVQLVIQVLGALIPNLQTLSQQYRLRTLATKETYTVYQFKIYAVSGIQVSGIYKLITFDHSSPLILSKFICFCIIFRFIQFSFNLLYLLQNILVVKQNVLPFILFRSVLRFHNHEQKVYFSRQKSEPVRSQFQILIQPFNFELITFYHVAVFSVKKIMVVIELLCPTLVTQRTVKIQCA